MTSPRGFIVVMVAAVTLGCGRSPASPSSVPVVTPPQTLTIASGWDRTPVTGAIVHLDGAATPTSSTGEFTVPAGAPIGMAVDVDADGFLPPRTRLYAVPQNHVISLWPVANETRAFKQD